MSAKTTVKKVSVKSVNIRRAISNVISKSAKDFKNRTRRRMIDEIPSGRVYKRRNGFHRASSRGERPAIDTSTLSSALQDTRNSPFMATVDVAHRNNSGNGQDAHDYAEILVESLGRVIFSEEDVRTAQAKFDRDLEKAVSPLF